MPESSYERELGGINATLGSIETTLSGLGDDLKEDRHEAQKWRQAFRDALSDHAKRTDDAIDSLGLKQTATAERLESHIEEVNRRHRLIWRVLLGGSGGGGTLFLAWQQAKAAVVNFFR